MLLILLMKLYFQIFTGIFPRHYDPPDGFTFEINDVSPPIQVNLVKYLSFFFLLLLNFFQNEIFRCRMIFFCLTIMFKSESMNLLLLL